MKIKSAFWSLWTLVVWCILLSLAEVLGKKSGFAWLGGGTFQRGTAILLCLSESLGILLCLKVIIEGRATIRKTLLPLLIFSLFYLSVLGGCLVAALYTPRLYTIAFDAVNEVTLPPLVKKLYQGNLQPEQERGTATAIYQLHGIIVPYKKDGTTYSLYVPSQKDIESWKKEEIGLKSAGESLKRIELLQKEFPTQIIIYIFSFFTVLLIGGIAIGMKRKPLLPTQSP